MRAARLGTGAGAGCGAAATGGLAGAGMACTGARFAPGTGGGATGCGARQLGGFELSHGALYISQPGSDRVGQTDAGIVQRRQTPVIAKLGDSGPRASR